MLNSKSKKLSALPVLSIALFSSTACAHAPAISEDNMTQNAEMTAVNPPGANIPGISQAMIVESGRLAFLSGHVPIGEDGTFAQGLEAQLDLVFSNLNSTLSEMGADFDNVVRVTIYVRDYDIKELPTIRTVRDKYVNAERPPASALIGVDALFHPDAIVEIDAVAVISRVAGTWSISAKQRRLWFTKTEPPLFCFPN